MPGVSFRLLIMMINDEDLNTDHIDANKACCILPTPRRSGFGV